MQLHPLPPQPELNIPALERSLDLASLTNSYKLYWFAALLDEINTCKAEITFKKMIILMLVKCWYTVLKFRLNFGSLDMLHRLVHYLHEKYSIPAEINETDLKEYLFKLNDPEFDRGINDFTKYVPYRFLSPFFAERLRGKPDTSKNKIIEELSCRSDIAPYRIRTGESKIELNYNWFEYLYCNMAIITGWYKFRLVEFLQRRNPNTPSVIDKIYPPLTRNLTEAKKFWKAVISLASNPSSRNTEILYNGAPLIKERGAPEAGVRSSSIGFDGPITDIYTGLPIKESDMSLDHFIPWSFVLHDRLWNLTPVAKSVNSSKSDNLPDLSMHLESFCSLQYMAYTTALKHNIKKTFLEDYLLLSQGIDLSTCVSETVFTEQIKNTIIPLHRIARNQGFPMWK